jgi:uncharacterized membrane protein YfcA
MEYIIIAIAAAFTAGLTLFSGFGLGTLLMPVFALFFPIQTAISMTAIVHFMNNLFKLILLGKHADRDVVIRFGVPAIFAAFLGAWLLLWFSELPPLFNYSIGSAQLAIEPVKLIIAVLMVVFAIMEINKKLADFSVDRKYLPVGGILSGFFGGISGHQGALRSAFLIKCGLSKEAFIASGVVIASIVDVSRIFVYSSRYAIEFTAQNTPLLIIAVLSAFVGAFTANRLLDKITLVTVQRLIALLLFLIALGLASGII